MLKQKDWIQIIVEKTGCTKKDAKIYYDCVFDYMREQINPEENIKISGFGVFKLRKTAAKEQINLATGEAEIVPEHQVVTFKPYIEIDPKPQAIDIENDVVAAPAVKVVEEVEEVEDVIEPVVEQTPVEEPVVEEPVVEEAVAEEDDHIVWVYNKEKKDTKAIKELLAKKTKLSEEDIATSLKVVIENVTKLNKEKVEVKEEDDSFNFVIVK